MLPPVRTISGSSGSYQNSSSVSASAHLTGEPIFPGQAADADRDVNPNLTGKLNILLLNGRDSVSESLSMLAEALGRTIHLPRQEGEGPFAYAQRLADALKTLPAGLRADVERQLNLILQGVRLEVVIQALAHPTGPEAARIVALLEMAGLKERDLATRTVLTSYRQNGGADVASEAGHFQGPPSRLAVQSLPAGAALELPPGNPDLAEVAVPPFLPEGDDGDVAVARNADIEPDLAGAGIEAIALPDETADGPSLSRFHHETDNIFSRTSAREPDVARSPVDQMRAQLDPGRAAEPAPERSPGAGRQSAGVIDARGLQSVLRSAFEAGENSDPVIQAKAAMELLAGVDPAPDAPSGFAGRRETAASKPFIDYTRPPPRPAPLIESHQIFEVLKGWTVDPAGSGLPILPASLEAEAALAAALAPHAGPEPDGEDQSYQLRGRGTAANDSTNSSHKAALAAAEQQLLQNADEAAGLPAGRAITRSPGGEATAPEALLRSALQLSQDLRLAIPYVQHPYPAIDAHEEGAADRPGFRSRSDDTAGDEEEAEPHNSGSSQDGDDNGSDGHPDADGEVASADMADPAYDLYQRMAGWN